MTNPETIESILLTIAANMAVMIILAVLWALVVLVTAWQCLMKQKGIDRLTWLVAILALPLVGVIAYYWKGEGEGTMRQSLDSLDDL